MQRQPGGVVREQKADGFVVHGAVTLHKGVYGEIPQDMSSQDFHEEWMEKRFQQWYQGNVAVIAGSTFANNRLHGEEKTLDAAAVRKYYDADGVLKRVVALTFDGLDHDDLVSGDNKKAIEEIDRVIVATPPNSPVKLKEALIEAGKAVCEKRQQEADVRGGRQIDVNGSAIAATLIQYNEDDSLSHVSANMGDTMVVILDGRTLEIKSMIPARQYIHKHVESDRQVLESSPIPFHLVQHNPDALLLDTTTFSPGDIVLQMTDGVFDDLDTQMRIEEKKKDEKERDEKERDEKERDEKERDKKEKDEKEKEKKGKDEKVSNRREKTAVSEGFSDVTLKPAALKTILQSQQEEKKQDEHQVAMTVMNYANIALRKKREEDVKFQAAFHQWRNEHYLGSEGKKGHIQAHLNEFLSESGTLGKKPHEVTMAEWFAWKEAKGKTTADDVYPFEQLKQDFEIYFPFIKKCFNADESIALEARKAIDLHETIGKSFLKGGDDATISVMRVPDPDVELVRALIDFPENRDRLALRLDARIKQREERDKKFDIEDWKKNIIDTLRAEMEISPGSRGSVEKYRVYTDDQLEDVANFIKTAALKDFIAKIHPKTIQIFSHEKLIRDLRKDKRGQSRKVQERNQMFVAFKQKQILYHEHNIIDSIFGIHNTESWKRVIEQIRQEAYRQLQDELKELVPPDDLPPEVKDIKNQIKLLERYRILPIFNDHQNNSILFGAFGRTQTVINMDNKIKALKKQLEAHPETRLLPKR